MPYVSLPYTGYVVMNSIFRDVGVAISQDRIDMTEIANGPTTNHQNTTPVPIPNKSGQNCPENYTHIESGTETQ